MLIVLPYCHKEIAAIKNLLTWMGERDDRQPERHIALFVASYLEKENDIKDIIKQSKSVFEKVDAIRQVNEYERGWPQSCNSLFRVANEYVSHRYKTYYWWNETDCIPLKPGWLTSLEIEYLK